MRNLIKKMKNADTELLEFWLDVVTTAWGVVLLLPFQTFQTSNSFPILAEVAPEWLMGLVFFLLGLTQIYSMLRPEWKIHRVTTFIACLIWAFVSVGLFIANPTGTSSAIYPFIVGGYIWVFARMGVVKHTEV